MPPASRVARLAAFFLALSLARPLLAAPRPPARRLVLIKVDGLGQATLERWLKERDPGSGKSVLPWIDHVFVQGGTYLKNFYVRGISLSVPSWSMLDTGRYPVIHGNAEFDRATTRVYDYLNFFPFYFRNARNTRADMPGVEVLDEVGIPLLIDSFRPEERLQGMQLFERGVRWQTVRSLLPRRFGRSVRQLFNEWQAGFELSAVLGEQVESEMIAALANSRILYLDYFFGDYDHVAHLANDDTSQRQVLEKLDRLIGRIWTAIESSPLAAETTLVLVSDHGMNSDPAVYSQAFDLVSFFGAASGGGHHVMTNRHPESEYKLKGLDPFVSEVITPSRESLYLRDEAGDYPTALLDLDGNERAAVYLRNSDLNAMHVLMKLTPRAERAERILPIIDSNRDEWSRTAAELDVELAALRRAIERNRKAFPPQSKKPTEQDKRTRSELDTWERQLRNYGEYRKWLRTILTVSKHDLSGDQIKTADLIPERALMDRNSIHHLQQYVVNGNTLGDFTRVDYFKLLSGNRVRNTQQGLVDPKPIDFIAVPAPVDALRAALPESDWPDLDGIWLYAGEDRQALILARRSAGTPLRYLPVKNLQQDAQGRITFERREFGPDLPLRYFEDDALKVTGDRARWMAGWHSQAEWFGATHQARYSNGIVALAQHFAPIELGPSSTLWAGSGEDEPVLRRFALRLRNMVASDLLLFANDHWNFNVRGFNPGGNHGSLLRVSTHSVLMFAGAGIQAGNAIETPYDSLSFVPALLRLTGRERQEPLPGPVIQELAPGVYATATHRP